MGMVVLERPTSVTTYMKIKSQNLKLITSSCTEISAILSDSGKTVHCNFKLLIPCLPNFSCRIAPDSERAKVLREATLFKIKENSCCPRMLYKPLIDFEAIFLKWCSLWWKGISSSRIWATYQRYISTVVLFLVSSPALHFRGKYALYNRPATF